MKILNFKSDLSFYLKKANTNNIIEEVFLFKFPLLRLQLVSMTRSEKRKMHRSFLDPLEDMTVIMSCLM